MDCVNQSAYASQLVQLRARKKTRTRNENQASDSSIFPAPYPTAMSYTKGLESPALGAISQ